MPEDRHHCRLVQEDFGKCSCYNSKEVSHLSCRGEKESDRRRYSLPFPARCCPIASQMRLSWVWVYIPYILITGTIGLYLNDNGMLEIWYLVFRSAKTPISNRVREICIG
jgi:hypothetical protein